MKILKCQFSDGAIIPVLLYSNNSCPVFLPLTYTILSLRGKSYQTCYISIVSIKLLYEFFDSLGLNFEELAIAGEFQPIFDKLDSVIHFLYVGQQDVKPTTSNPLFDTYLRGLKFFFKWLIARYSKESNQNLLSLIDEKFTSSSLHLPSFASEYKNLDDHSVQIIRNLVLPTSGRNPFKEKNRLRNWLMIELLLQTGIRSGELLNLKVPDIYKNGENYYLRIRQSSEQETNTDPRWKKPSIKNRHSIRTVAISKTLFIAFEKYLSPGHRKKRQKNKHGYLFTSERGSPLASNTLTAIFKRVEITLEKIPVLAVKLTPHVLRHTFVEKMLCYLLEVKSMEMERAKDELRNICGWSINSPMPNHYARRYIAMAANKHNLERINFSLNT